MEQVPLMSEPPSCQEYINVVSISQFVAPEYQRRHLPFALYDIFFNERGNCTNTKQRIYIRFSL